MTLYGGMDCDMKCEKCVINIRYGAWLGPYTLIIGGIFLESKSSDIFQFVSGLLKFILYRLHCFFFIHINGLLREIEECLQLGINFLKTQFLDFWFAEQFVIVETRPSFRSLIVIYCT